MNRPSSLKWSMRILLVASLVFNVIMAYAVVDRAMLADDLESEVHLRGETISTVSRLAPLILANCSRKEIEQKSRLLNPDGVVKWDSDTLWVDEVGLVFRDDSLAQFFVNGVR